MYKFFLFSSVKNKTILFAIVVFVCVLLLILILILVSKNDRRSRESFTPGLRMMYRPYIRSMRRHTADTYKRMSDRARIFLSKMKII